MQNDLSKEKAALLLQSTALSGIVRVKKLLCFSLGAIRRQ